MTTIVPRKELIADEVYVREEAKGRCVADRTETVLSAIFYCVMATACANGLDYNKVIEWIGNGEVTKPRFLTEEDIQERHKKEQREAFLRLWNK